MRLSAGLCLSALVLAGCISSATGFRMGPVDEMLRVQPDTACGVANLPDLTGEPMARLADFRLIGHLRVLWPGQEITSEIEPTRLNAQVDVSGRIQRLMCG